MDLYRRERERSLLQIAWETERIAPPEQCETRPGLPRIKSSPNLHDSRIDVPKIPPIASLEQRETAGNRPALPRNKSSPNLHDSGTDAPKVPPIVKARVSKSFKIPQSQVSNKYHLLADSESQLGTSSLSISSDTDALVKYAGSIHFLLPQKLAYAALTPAETSSLKEDCHTLKVFVLSSYLHRQYAPLCADFGPVTINIVHRFCQVCSWIFVPCISVSLLTVLSHRQAMEKRIAKAEQSNSLVIYCLDKDPASIANASFLLAAYLLLVVGMTVQEAARPFTGPSAPYALAAFRDASFCKQVCHRRGSAGSFPTCAFRRTEQGLRPRAGLRPHPARLPRRPRQGGPPAMVRPDCF